VITKAVGARDTIDLDVLEHDLQPGDLVMLCSDGLHGLVNDREIEQILLSSPSLEEVSARLVDAANEAGGRDNVTVVLLRRTA
jgi:PPM family protein phosphatase